MTLKGLKQDFNLWFSVGPCFTAGFFLFNMDGTAITEIGRCQARIQAGEDKLREIRERVRTLTRAKSEYENSLAFYQQQVQFYLCKLRENKISNISDKET